MAIARIRSLARLLRPEFSTRLSPSTRPELRFSPGTARQRKHRAERPRAEDYSREFLLRLYERMVLIREFEEGVKFLFLEGSMPGTIHQCQGQEATAVGVCAALEAGDFITSTFRGHGHALAKGLTPRSCSSSSSAQSTGCCRGKGGSMHVGNMEKGMVPGIAIVGGGIPLAAGMALAFKMQQEPAGRRLLLRRRRRRRRGVSRGGQPGRHLGPARRLRLREQPLRGLDPGRPGDAQRPHRRSGRRLRHPRARRVDGNDVLAVYEAARSAAAECRAGRGPVLLELLTYRRTGHSRRDALPLSAAGRTRGVVRPRSDRRFWASQLLDRGSPTPPKLEAIRKAIQAHFQAAVATARRQPLPSAGRPDDRRPRPGPRKTAFEARGYASRRETAQHRRIAA